MNGADAEFWNEARHYYSIGLLALGAVFIVLAIVMLCVLPAVLRVGRQLAEAAVMLANALLRNVGDDGQIREMAADVKTIKADVSVVKHDVAMLKKAA